MRARLVFWRSGASGMVQNAVGKKSTFFSVFKIGAGHREGPNTSSTTPQEEGVKAVLLKRRGKRCTTRKEEEKQHHQRGAAFPPPRGFVLPSLRPFFQVVLWFSPSLMVEDALLPSFFGVVLFSPPTLEVVLLSFSLLVGDAVFPLCLSLWVVLFSPPLFFWGLNTLCGCQWRALEEVSLVQFFGGLLS